MNRLMSYCSKLTKSDLKYEYGLSYNGLYEFSCNYIFVILKRDQLYLESKYLE